MSYPQPGPYGSQPGPYGSQPGAYGSQPGAYGQPPVAPPKRPGVVTAASVITIVIASILCLAAVGVLLFGGLFAAVSGSVPADSLANSGVANAEDVMALGVGIMLAIGLILLAIGVGMIICAAKTLRGRNWARIVITVLFALGILGTLGNLTQGGTETNVVGAALLVLVVVFYWVPPANAWFSASKPQPDAVPPTYPGAPTAY